MKVAVITLILIFLKLSFGFNATENVFSDKVISKICSSDASKSIENAIEILKSDVEISFLKDLIGKMII
jgi:hypothetical protein